ncbi:MAG TPA: SDR family NAD(P)-dependent oxidoreductase, partial [Steroidobacteraceae bacterium]|nr:SDR family NAD(P)-dependent oxidoreductase [Steroidobacteraceae bacterium]
MGLPASVVECESTHIGGAKSIRLGSRRQEALDAAVADLGPHAHAVQGSVSDLADLDRLYAAVKAERGTLDIVFANAGAGSQLALGKIT